MRFSRGHQTFEKRLLSYERLYKNKMQESKIVENPFLAGSIKILTLR